MYRNNEIPEQILLGATIICFVCRIRGLPSKHSPASCLLCLKCGVWGHKKKHCIEKTGMEFGTITRMTHPDMTLPDFIDNSEHLKEGESVAIDVESINGRLGKLAGSVSVVKHVPIYGRKGHEDIVYATYIRRAHSDVVNYCTPYSGLTREKLSLPSAVDFPVVRAKMLEILSNRRVIGIELSADLTGLGVEQEIHNRFEFLHCFRDIKGKPISIKQLAYAFHKKRIQNYALGTDRMIGHNAIIDSRTTLEIYRSYMFCEIHRKSIPRAIFPKFEEFIKANYGVREGKNTPDLSHQWVRDEVDDAIDKGLLPAHEVKKPKRKGNNRWAVAYLPLGVDYSEYGFSDEFEETD